MRRIVRKYAGVIALATVVCLSGCSAAADSSVKADHSSIQKSSQTKIRTFNGTSKVKAPNGQLWTPPAGSHQEKDGSIINEDGCVIGQTGPLKIPDNAVG